jgi:hypothetical protein
VGDRVIVVYTAIFGGSDSLKAAPTGADLCVCFTDDPTLAGCGWEVRLQPSAPSGRYAARWLKTGSVGLFPEATQTVWVDGSIALVDLTRLLADAGDADLACLAHPDRSTCYDEGRTVVALHRANPLQIAEALALYRSAGFAPASLSTTGLLVRQSTPRVGAFNRRWREHQRRFGLNDQVHVDFCAWREDLAVTYLTGHYRDNPYMRYDRADHTRRRSFNPPSEVRA